MFEFDVSLAMVALLFAVALLAGWVDAIAGGGGLITVPALLLAGVPPAAALATNKLQGAAGTFAASLYFIRKGAVELRSLRWMIVFTFLGAASGTALVLQIDPEQLMVVIPILLLVMGCYVLFSPSIDDADKRQLLSVGVFAGVVCFLLGFYDGFLGPGTGSFITLSFVLLLGYGLSRATAQAKVLNFVSNIASLLYFGVFGEIYWMLGLVMVCGQLLGAALGAKMVMDQGAKLVKPVVVTVCFLMSANLLIKAYG